MSIRDWQQHGIDVKVELGTAGDLLLHGEVSWIPLFGNFFVNGGAPFGWTRINGSNWTGNSTMAGNQQDDSPHAVFDVPPSLNFQYGTTQLGAGLGSPLVHGETFVMDVGAHTYARYNHWAGMYIDSIPFTVGKRYQIGVKVRTAPGADAGTAGIALQAVAEGFPVIVSHLGTSKRHTSDEYEQVLFTTEPLPAMYKLRIFLFAHVTVTNAGFGGTAPTTPIPAWGAQWTDLSIKELDDEPAAVEWRDISCDVRSLATHYGREKNTDRFDVGTLQVELRNDDGEYTYRETHPFGLRPGRPVRVTATHEATDYPQAFMVIDEISESYSIDGHVMASFSCIDPSSLLSSQATAMTDAGTDTIVNADERIDLLLDQIGYPLRDIQHFGNSPMALVNIDASDRSLRDEIGVTVDSEGSTSYADRLGQIVYRGRNWHIQDAHLLVVTAQLDAVQRGDEVNIVDETGYLPIVRLQTLDTSWPMARVINWMKLGVVGERPKAGVNSGETYGRSSTAALSIEVKDEDSIRANGPHPFERSDYLLWNLTNDLEIRANEIMAGNAEAKLRVDSASFAPGMAIFPVGGENAWEWCLSVFLEWKVRVTYVNPLNKWGFSMVTHVQSVDHRITPEDWEITCSFDRPRSYTEFALSTGGWDFAQWDTDIWDG